MRCRITRVGILIGASFVLTPACGGADGGESFGAPEGAPNLPNVPNVPAPASKATASARPRAAAPVEASCTDGDTEACEEIYGQHAGITNCFAGTRLCAGGVWGPCVPNPDPAEKPEGGQ